MRSVAKVLLLLAGIVLVFPAQGAQATPLPGTTGLFSISPGRRVVTATPPISLTPTTVLNTTNSPFAVSVFPAIVTQNLSGAFDFATTPQNLTASKLALSVSPTSFTLESQQQGQVQLRWNLLPRNRPWVAVGVIFQGIPRQQGRSLHVVDRLLSVNFLRLPGPYTITGDFTKFTVSQYAPRVLRFLPFVTNTGQMFGTPSKETFIIQDSRQQVVFSSLWKANIILPGATVQYPILVRKVLPAGHYVATVGMDFGGHRTRSLPFTLVGPNQLAAPAITVSGFQASGTVGSPAQLRASVLSSGTAPASVKFHLYLGGANELPGQPALATGTVAYRNLAPGSTTRLSRPLGESLKKGTYKVIMTWVDVNGTPRMLEAGFTALPSRSFWEQIWDWITDHWWLFLLLAVLILLAYIYNQERKRQRRMLAELAAARAAIAAVPPGPEEHAAPVPAGGPGPDRGAPGASQPEPQASPGYEWQPRTERPDAPPAIPGPDRNPRPDGSPGPDGGPAADGNPPDGNPGALPPPGADPGPQAGLAAGAVAQGAAGAAAAAGRHAGPSPEPAPEVAARPEPPPVSRSAPPVEAAPTPPAAPPDPTVVAPNPQVATPGPAPVAPGPLAPAPAAPPPGPAPAPGPPAPPPRPSSRRARRRAAVAVVVAVGAAGTVAVIRWRNRR